MQGISQAYDDEAYALESAIRRRTFLLFDTRVLRSIDRLPEGIDWDDSRFIVRTRRQGLSYTVEVSRLMLAHIKIDGALMVARMIADEYNRYDRQVPA